MHTYAATDRNSQTGSGSAGSVSGQGSELRLRLRLRLAARQSGGYQGDDTVGVELAPLRVGHLVQHPAAPPCRSRAMAVASCEYYGNAT